MAASARSAAAQDRIGAVRIAPNLASNIDRPLRYRPDRGDFVIENGRERFNRSLYGGNTAFRVEGGDKPEFALYLPGRGGNLRLGIAARGGAKWLQDAASIETRYRPGELLYRIRDPLLGKDGNLSLAAVAYAETEGLIVRVEAHNLAPDVELVFAYGGVNGQRGKRDGDIGTEKIPISQWFQLRPEYCRRNAFAITPEGFILRARPATIAGVTSSRASIALGDATKWDDLGALLRSAGVRAGSSAGAGVQAEARPPPYRVTAGSGLARDSDGRLAPATPVAVGRVALADGRPFFVSLQRVRTGPVARTRSEHGAHRATPARPGETGPEGGDLDVYREVTAADSRANGPAAARTANLPEPRFDRAELPARFASAEAHFATLRHRVSVETPDPFLDAAAGALNVATDALWDGPQHAIMHGAIAWRTRLLGWRGPYALDALGWHRRARENFDGWIAHQDTGPVPARMPPPGEKWNLARNEAGLHSNGDLSHSHYDMNLVFIDALLRHLEWTGDLAYAKKVWPVIVRHLAWERRLFRREYGAEKLPLYEAYAAIWASDDLQYDGGGTAHASAYNFFENRQAARLARRIGADPTPYDRESDLIARAMRRFLWVSGERQFDGREPKFETARSPSSDGGIGAAESNTGSSDGWFAEYKDWLGLRRTHPSAALWTYYITIDSGVPTPEEAWKMTLHLDAEIPHIPVAGWGVPPGLCTLATSDWMPYDWSINNVVMGEAMHGALALWEAGRPAEAWSVMKGSVLAAMFMGISPGNVGSMSYLDVYRRESQRDFGDGAGVLSRALVEGLFGVKPDAIAGELRIAPGWPSAWDHAAIRHPDFSFQFTRNGDADTYVIRQRWTWRPPAASEDAPSPLRVRLRLVARRDRIAGVTIDGVPAGWRPIAHSIDMPRIEVLAPPAARCAIVVHWAGKPVARAGQPVDGDAFGGFRTKIQGQMAWLEPVSRGGVDVAVPAPRPALHGSGESEGDCGPWARAMQSCDDELPTVTHPTGQSPPMASGAGGGAGLRLAAQDPRFTPVDLSRVFNDRVARIFRNEYRSPRSPFVSLAIPKQGIGGWAGGVNRTAIIDDSGLRAESLRGGGKVRLPNGVPLVTPSTPDARNVVFASRWDNYPDSVTIPLSGHARCVYLLVAGSTDPMQCRFENGEVDVTYADGSRACLPLVNPINWWPIEQDYFIDDYQFRRPGPLPMRIDLRTGRIRVLKMPEFKGRGGSIPGGAGTVLLMNLDERRGLKSLTVRAIANDVVVGLMAATLVR